MALWSKLKKFFGIEQKPTTSIKRDEFGRWVDDSPKAKPATVKVELVPATTGTKPTDIPKEVIKPSQSSAKKPKPKPTAKAAPATATAKKPLKEASRDGDGDGFINDGKPNQRRVEPKKKPSATAKKKPKPKA